MVVRNSQQRRFSMRAGLAAIAFLPAAFVGCATSKWSAKPSWWASGKSADATKLTAAPAFGGDVTKPSDSAKPYPVTTTPDGYVISDRDGATATTAAAPVTYGTTPAPATVAADRGLPPAASPLTSVSPSVGGVTAQVGPYASSSGGAPPPLDSTPASAGSYPANSFTAAPPTSGFATAPAAAADPSSASPLNGAGWSASRGSIDALSAAPAAASAGGPPPLTPVAPTRTADARSAVGFAPAAAPAADASSRYGAATGSRFGGPTAPAGYEQPAQPPAAFPTPLPTELPPAAQPAAPAAPAAFPTVPAGAAQPGAPAAQPPAPGAAPVRRADPFYRPAGTSSYRPSRELLDEEPEASTGDVQPVSYDAPPAG